MKSETNNMKFEETAKRFRKAISNMGLTQQELADKTKIGKSSISHYINGANTPGNKHAYILSEALNVNPAWLMGFDVPMDRTASPDPAPAARPELTLSPHEEDLVLSYRNASDDTQIAACAVLGVKRDLPSVAEESSAV